MNRPQAKLYILVDYSGNIWVFHLELKLAMQIGQFPLSPRFDYNSQRSSNPLEMGWDENFEGKLGLGQKKCRG